MVKRWAPHFYTGPDAEAVRKSGKTQIVTLTPAERLELKKALVKVHTEQAGRIGEDLLKAIYKETNFDPTKM